MTNNKCRTNTLDKDNNQQTTELNREYICKRLQ